MKWRKKELMRMKVSISWLLITGALIVLLMAVAVPVILGSLGMDIHSRC
jgi:hypothetical protein